MPRPLQNNMSTLEIHNAKSISDRPFILPHINGIATPHGLQKFHGGRCTERQVIAELAGQFIYLDRFGLKSNSHR